MAEHGDDAFGGLLADFDAHDTLDAPADEPVADPEPPAPEHIGEADPGDELAPHQRVFTPAIPDLDDDEIPPPPSRHAQLHGAAVTGGASRRSRRLALAALAVATCAVIAASRHPSRTPAPGTTTMMLAPTDARTAASPHRHRHTTRASRVAGDRAARQPVSVGDTRAAGRPAAPHRPHTTARPGPPSPTAGPGEGGPRLAVPPQAAEFDPDVTPTERTQP